MRRVWAQHSRPMGWMECSGGILAIRSRPHMRPHRGHGERGNTGTLHPSQDTGAMRFGQHERTICVQMTKVSTGVCDAEMRCEVGTWIRRRS
jgi:hypothetical protein